MVGQLGWAASPVAIAWVELVATRLMAGTFIILVVDSTDQDRLPVVKEELCKILAHDELAKASLLVLANKQDVKSALSSADISRELNLTSLKRHHWRIQACCALTGEG
ncbi:ADP-ribosylation factor-like protein 5A [Amphibalanus amphitrite]|uniref:ADP-ribosylation factor-like protein 5A n=1 Tax=Amphibalanus amphitrite TaxID=1232801 RepID=A0A6A4VK93_AMPAM|nr:ADP-ribosylation factor-like protein 5A [Amphibalanus amphitrite]